LKYRRQRDPAIRQRRRRRTVAVLPTLFTLGNCLCGFASLHYAAKGDVGATGVSNYAIAGYLIFLAMVFDMLDGRMARLAKATSDFGGELDSLADMLSFGAAPAFLTLSVISKLLYPGADAGGPYDALGPFAEGLLGRLFWIIGAIYVSCTALRLARFNVHNKHAEDSHMSFQGLPSPGAAGVVASSVIFFETLQPTAHHLVAWGVPLDPKMTGLLRSAFPYAMPVVLLMMALLMVSRLNFAHVTNQYLRGRRPFSYVVRLVVVVALLVVWPQLTALAVIYVYAFSAPVAWAFRSVFRRNQPVLVERLEMEQAQESELRG
jgi:CDP-diacylglycerol---serine O-phosphatidyltransferase